MIAQRWSEPFGDRPQELVLIGTGIDEAALRARFDACLLTDAEINAGPHDWENFVGPFPARPTQSGTDSNWADRDAVEA